MEAYARAPLPLIKDGDMASNWQSWKEAFIIFMKVTGYINEPNNEARANFLKNQIGIVGIKAIQNISFDNMQDKDDMDILIKKLDEYFNPPKKDVVERYQFFSRSKKQNESIEQYISILKEKAKTCNFNDMTDSIIRDKIILDTHDEILRKKFFEADNLDFPKLVAIYNDYNINIEKMKEVTKGNKAEPTSFTQKPLDNDLRKCCWRCGEQHPLRNCPAWRSKCTNCGDINHFTWRCKYRRPRMNDYKNNDKWNNQAYSAAKTTNSMNKMVSVPNIPTAPPCDAVNSAVGNDSTFDSVIVNTHNSSSKLCHDNIAKFPHLIKSTAYSHSCTKGVEPDGILTDLCNKGESSQPKQTETACAGISEVPNRSPYNGCVPRSFRKW